MGDTHGIWCCRALHQRKAFLPRQGRTLKHASTLVDTIFARSYVASIVVELIYMYSPSTYHLEIGASSHGNLLDEYLSLGSPHHI